MSAGDGDELETQGVERCYKPPELSGCLTAFKGGDCEPVGVAELGKFILRQACLFSSVAELGGKDGQQPLSFRLHESTPVF